MTQLFSRKIVHYGPGPYGNVTVEGIIEVKESRDSPFFNVSRPKYEWAPCSCAKMSWSFGPLGCRPPYLDHSHFTGNKKPWKYQKPNNLWDTDAPPSDFYVWWRAVEQLRKEGVPVSFKEGSRSHKDAKDS